MDIGIIGAGAIGRAFAAQAARAGYRVAISNSRGAQSLREVAARIGKHVTAVDRVEAAQASLVLLAVQWQHLPIALEGLGNWGERIVLDATNPILPGFQMAELGGRNSSQIVAEMAPGARLVKGANTLPPTLLGADPLHAGGRRVLFVSGDEASSKGEVSKVLQRMGFATIDVGSLAVGGSLQQFPGGPLPALDLIQLS